jgi:GPH family glycoside/pentoside/hexuronide:cation symporter
MNKASPYKKLVDLIGGREVLAFSVTVFGMSMVSSLMGPALSFFYTEVLHIGVGAVGTIFLVARIWDAFNDPIMGFVVDRTHGKNGKCIPFLRTVPIPLFLTSIFMFLPVQNLAPNLKVIYAGAFLYPLLRVIHGGGHPVQRFAASVVFGPTTKKQGGLVQLRSRFNGLHFAVGIVFCACAAHRRVGEKSPKGNFITASSIIGIGCLCVLLSAGHLKEKIIVPPRKERIF